MAAGDKVVDAILVNGVSGRRDEFDNVIQKAGAQRQNVGYANAGALRTCPREYLQFYVGENMVTSTNEF